MLVLAELTIPQDLSAFGLVPLIVLGVLMAVTLLLELKDDLEPGQLPTEHDAKPAVVGLAAFSLVGLIGYYVAYGKVQPFAHFNQMLLHDKVSIGAGLLIALCALLAILSGPDELERRRNQNGGEFCALIFASSLGMVLMASAANTMVMFLGLELFSIALYLLCIFFPDSSASRESGMKYFLLSSGASAVLLYGLALLYGATGSTWLYETTGDVSTTASPMDATLALVGVGLVLCGLLFKLAAVPFHFWAPDVYEGAPTTVTAYMSVATKVAALAALWRFADQFSGTKSGALIHLILFSLAVLSMLIGNFLALVQKNVKRMLAYSGVANGGYLLIAPIVGEGMETPLLFFLAGYLFANVGAFLAVAQIEAVEDRTIERQDLRGLYHRSPWVAGAFALCLVSLTGLPPAAGFMGKFLLFGKAMAGDYLILPIFGVVGSLIGAAYYLGTAVALFARPEEEPTEEDGTNSEAVTGPSQIALAICCVGVLVLGVVPGPLLEWLGP